MTQFVVRPVAETDLEEISDWYDQKRAGLGQDVLDDISFCFDEIKTNPKRYPIVYADIREGVASQFPYCVYYRTLKTRTVIIGVIHTARDPAVWQSRR